MSILGVIVNYRTPALTLKAVRSLVAETQPLPDVRIVVVDNASGDDSVATLRAAIADEGWGHRVEVQAAPYNGGFGYGINLVVRDALATAPAPDYVYILNPDAEVEPGSLARMLDFAATHPHAGVVGNHIRGGDYQSQV